MIRKNVVEVLRRDTKIGGELLLRTPFRLCFLPQELHHFTTRIKSHIRTIAYQRSDVKRKLNIFSDIKRASAWKALLWRYDPPFLSIIPQFNLCLPSCYQPYRQFTPCYNPSMPGTILILTNQLIRHGGVAPLVEQEEKI